MEKIDAIPVSKLNGYLKSIIDSEELLINIRVYGEITDFTLSKNIAYFSLKDESALISCVCFSSAFYSLIKNGAQVVLTGSPKFWVKGGRLSFQVQKVEDFGKGKAYLDFIALKEKLEKQGLFDASKKQSVPKWTRKIGVVTSSTGAVIRDIYNVALRRNPYVNIVLYPSQVQGEGASKTIIEGLKFLDSYGVDVIVIARGGGSAEDLSAFNNEELALEISKAKTPIVSAVGHETDFTICDFVADLRAPTPSAAAELITLDISAFKDYLKNNAKKMANTLNSKIELNLSKIDLFKSKMATSLNNNFQQTNFTLINNAKNLKNINENYLDKKMKALELLDNSFSKINPLEVLKRGFAKLSKDGIVPKFEEILVGDNLDIEIQGGTINAKVNSKKEKK